MALRLEFFNIIIPISIIEKRYSGGFGKYKVDNAKCIGKTIWFDKYLVREGAMNSKEISDRVQYWWDAGCWVYRLNAGEKIWNEVCVCEQMGGDSPVCEWLGYIQSENAVFLKGFPPAEIIGKFEMQEILNKPK